MIDKLENFGKLISSVEYNTDTEKLVLTTTSGKEYRYINVNNKIWNGFKNSTNKEGYFYRFVKTYGEDKLSKHLSLKGDIEDENTEKQD